MKRGPKVIVFSPVRQAPEVLKEALASHLALRGISDLWYVDDNDDDSFSSLLLRGIGAKVFYAAGIERLPAREPYHIDDSKTHQWTGSLMARMAGLRDFAIQEFLKTDADFLFMIDSDVLPNPGLVEHLVSLDMPLVTEVYWSQWSPLEPWLPNVWDTGNYGFTNAEHVIRLREPGTFRVGGLGSVTLMRRDALEMGARYEMMPEVEYPGEDRHFSTRAAALGIPMYVDSHLPAFHIYRPSEQLEEAKAWRLAGSDPAYWRETYLTDEWASHLRADFLAPVGHRAKVIACMLPGESFHSMWVSHWSTLLAEMCKRYSVAMAWGYTSNVYATRNMLGGCVFDADPKPDFVFWIDDDQLVSVEDFNLLMGALVNHPGVDVIAGATWIQADAGGPTALSCGRLDESKSKVLPFSWREFRTAAQAKELLECEYTGFPVVLMRAEAFERAGRKAFSPFMTGGHWGFSGEDVAWCIRAREAGVRIFVEPRVIVPHMKLRAIQRAVSEEEESGLAMAAD